MSSALALGISVLQAAWVLPKEAAEQEVTGREQEPLYPFRCQPKDGSFAENKGLQEEVCRCREGKDIVIPGEHEFTSECKYI